MRRWLLVRLGWMFVTLFGVTFVTFATLELAPIDRAELAAERATRAGSYVDRAARAAAIQQLRVRYGLVDAATGEPVPLLHRYGAWLGRVATLRLAGPGEDDAALRRRLAAAAPVTALLGGIALVLAFGVGMPFGAWLGRRAGERRERTISGMLLAIAALPDFLLATLLLLVFSVVCCQWFPASGLTSRGAADWSLSLRALDLAWHLALPCLVLALGPFVLVARFVRDAVARAAAAPFVTNLVALGVEPRTVHRRLLRHGATPAATLAGSLLPMLVGGSIVVESLFGLDGLGRLAFRAVLEQELSTILALVLLTSFATVLALVVSDVLHRLVDPRVRLHS